MTRLDNIDRREDPKAWLHEVSRIERQRDLRFECMKIARHLQPAAAGDGARQLVEWLNQPLLLRGDVRLDCLRVSWKFDVTSIEELLSASDALLAFVTEADNG